MKEHMKDVGERVRQARLAKGLSQGELAEKVGISVPSISNIENGKHDMRASVLIKISDTLNVSADWLLRNRTKEAQQCVAEDFNRLFEGNTPAEDKAMLEMMETWKNSIRNIKKADMSDN